MQQLGTEEACEYVALFIPILLLPHLILCLQLPPHLAFADGPEGEHPYVTIISHRNTWKIHLELNTLSLPPPLTQDFSFLPDVGKDKEQSGQLEPIHGHTWGNGWLCRRGNMHVGKGFGTGTNTVG